MVASSVELTSLKLGKNDVVVDDALARDLLPRRSFGAHKWGVGGVVIVAGSPGYYGAPMLSAMAAGRAGAGIVNLAVPRQLVGAIAIGVPEAAFVPLPETESLTGARRAVETIKERLERAKAIVIGPGLGQDEAVDQLMRAIVGGGGVQSSIGFGIRGSNGAGADGEGLLTSTERPAVIDADGLNWLAKQDEWWRVLPEGRVVLTPHVGEMARLTGESAEAIAADPLTVAKDAATKWKQVVVLKYGYSIATDGKQSMVAGDAPTSLATAGTGDVLAGTIGAFLAQGLEPLGAAGLALHVGSKAARRVEERFGTLGLVASDLPAAIAEELAALERGETPRE